MAEVDRLTRVNELLKREIATILEKRLLERGNAFVLLSVTEVNTSVDLRNATVYISIFGNDNAMKHKLMNEVEKSRIQIQKDIAKNLKFKHTPVLNFKLDTRLERGDMVLELLNKSEEETEN
ncbi:MAG: 30S ribosome-binding factor RbfA [Lentisphaeria bacterium]|nr:30S ribosome-binding factor RbfA [Lentisphaeria bacterium]MBR7127309.1 30S ribosome-binding factor RbfA [Lentisphaeria bacterium]